MSDAARQGAAGIFGASVAQPHVGGRIEDSATRFIVTEGGEAVLRKRGATSRAPVDVVAQAVDKHDPGSLLAVALSFEGQVLASEAFAGVAAPEARGHTVFISAGHQRSIDRRGQTSSLQPVTYEVSFPPVLLHELA